ncbi:MAG TPA: hypothetical protein VFI61_03310 [Patescibacteria group bacterium]|nr:hypothetical protein [Patescibacteria group bacterium]
MTDTSFTSLISSAQSILIVLPTKPYFDQVASALALYLSLKDKANINLFCPIPMNVSFNRLVGINMVKSEVGNKNLTLKFVGYDANNIEKVSYDIENSEFKLTVVPKAGLPAPEKEQLDLSFSGASADLVILIGGANDTHFPILASEELANLKIAHIGTRVLASSRDILSFAKPGSSASELVANLIKEGGLELDADTATNLVMGVEEGSNHFESSEVTPETFETFAHLLRSGGKRPLRERLSPTNFPAGSIPTQPFDKPVMQAPVINESETTDPENTQETEQVINPPADWLAQPKVYKGASSTQPDSYSENKG